MKSFSILCWTLVLATHIAQSQTPGFLRARNARIVNDRDEEVALRGMGLGGWMLQEGYMLGLRNEGTQHSIKARIADLIGKADCDRFYQLWLQNHMTRADVELLAKSGFNSIRLPMHYSLFTLPIEDEPVKGQNTWLPTGFELTDHLLAWCKSNRMYLTLDLHAAPGGQGKDANICDYDPTKPSLWESEANRQKTVALWRRLAERYANEPWIGGYDLLNEPNWTFEGKDKNGKDDTSNKPIWDLYQTITQAIREVDQNHLIIIEGNGWGNNYNGFPGPWDDKLVMSFHKYWNPNTQEAIARFLALREQYHLPLWLGESGENNNQWFRECVALVESNHIGWAWWPHKKIDSASCTLTIKRPDDFKKVVDYWNKRGERPSREVAAKGLFELAENCKAANCRFNPNVVQALIPSGPPSSSFNVIAFYTGKSDRAHISFVQEADRWFARMAAQANFSYNSTTNWAGLNDQALAQHQVVVFLDSRPENPTQREAFRRYMEKGGAWLGFHFAAFALTPSAVPQNWDWYHDEFLGSGSYVGNTWRPTSAVLRVEAADHPATRHLPVTFKSAPNEWYKWTHDLRTNSDIKILLSIDPQSFPLGTGPKAHEIWHEGYYPVVWTNTRYRMVYVNMGHNDIDYEGKTNKELSFTFENETQSRLILDSLLWLGGRN